MNVRLVHLPVELPPEQAPRGPFINIMPVGMLALADRLDRDGHEVEVVHAGVERRLDPAFDCAADLTGGDVDLVGVSLHWHHQLGPVTGLIESLHARRPDLPVVVGGWTASVFAEDLLGRFAGIDFVVCGEGERPLSLLADSLQRRSGIEDVPNLVRREGGRAIRNPGSYVASADDLDDLAFGRLELLRHAEHYNSQFAMSAGAFGNPPVFYLGTGRGCSVDCAFCSGGRSGHRLVSGRDAPILRGHESVLADLVRLVDHRIDTACVCFDPPPRSQPYYLDLFERIRGTGIQISMVFECYLPPSQTFLEAFATTFEPGGSRLSFSPTVADEGLRDELLGVRYTNAELTRSLQTCRSLGVPTTLYFALVPQESRAGLLASLDWQRELQASFGSHIVVTPLEIEPGSPWARDPAKFGLVDVRSGLEGYLARHRRSGLAVRYADEVGYSFPDVDARVVRSASANLPSLPLLARAFSTCGQALDERQVVLGPGGLPAALDRLASLPPVPMTMFVPEGDADFEDWRLFERAAAALGPNLRLLAYDPDTFDNHLWDGVSVPASPDPGRLHVLNLDGADAADRLVAQGAPALRELPPGVVLGEACRWAPQPCPARALGLVALDAEGAAWSCASSPDLGTDPAAWLSELRERQALIERQRDCARCPVSRTCSRCLFTGGIQEFAFCEIRRSLGPDGFSADWRRSSIRIAGASVGWDD